MPRRQLEFGGVAFLAAQEDADLSALSSVLEKRNLKVRRTDDVLFGAPVLFQNPT
jgi:hypothetical protein